MGIRPQLSDRLARRQATSRHGAALPAALFGLVTVTLLATAILSASTMQSSAIKNREASARALQLAEDGLAHAVTVVRDTLKGMPFTRLLRGSDNTLNTTDDGRVTGFGMSSNINIPAAGRSFGSGSYVVSVFDDDDGDGNLKADVNYRVRMRCTATTSDGGAASVEVVLGTYVLPAIASNGNINLSNNPKALGYCGAIHANENLTIASGSNVTVASSLTAGGTVSGVARDTLGVAKSPIGGRDTVTIPSLTYPQFCGAVGTNATTNFTDVEFWMTSAGLVYRRGNPVGTAALTTATRVNGWFYTLTTKTWAYSGSTGVPGKLCIEGNVDISGNVGAATAPMQWSIIATGSVRVSGTPYLAPATSDSISIISGGDVSIAGNPSGSATSYEGLVYAHSQCLGTGSATMRGQLLCANNATPVGATEYVATTTLQGNFSVTYGCGGMLARRRIYSWLHRVD